MKFHSSVAKGENTMEVKLIWMDGSVFSVKISLAATCDDLITLLHRRGTISNGCPRLLLGSSLLDGSERLTDMGVSDGSELQLILSRPYLHLDASDNNLGAAGLEALVEGLPGPLQRASFLRNGLCGKAGGQAVAKLLKASPGLEFLDVSGNNGFGSVSLCDTGIDLKALVAEIHTCYSLLHLILADCSLEGLVGGQHLASLLCKAPNLQCLDVHSNNNLGTSGVLALARAVGTFKRPVKLTSLTLEDTGLEEENGGAAVAEILNCMPLLTQFNISNNLLLATGFQALVENMPGKTCLSRLGACNVGLPHRLDREAAMCFQLLLSKCPELQVVESEGHFFEGPPDLTESLSRMDLLKASGEVDSSTQLPKISQLALEHPLSAADLQLLTGLSLQELQKLASFSLGALNANLHGTEGGLLLINVLVALPNIQHLSFNTSSSSCAGSPWASDVVLSILLESLGAPTHGPINRPHISQSFPRLQLTLLKSINFSECGLQADAGYILAELLQALPQLRYLSLAKNHRLENAGLHAFGRRLQEERYVHLLAEIDLSCCSIVGEEGKVAIIAILQKLPDLQTLALSSNPGLGSHNAASLLEHVVSYTRISSLSLASCGISASDAHFNLGPSRSLHLTSLDISGNTEIGPSLKSFTLPKMNLQRLNLSDCGLESANGASLAALLSQCQNTF